MPEEKIPPEIAPEPGPESQPVVEPVSEPEISEIPPKPAGSRLKIILLSVLGLVLVGGLVFAGYRFGQQQSQPGPTPTPLPSEVSTKGEDLVANWETYTNTNYDFSFKYSPTMVLEEIFPEDDRMYISINKNRLDSFTIEASRDYLPGDVESFLDTSSNGERTINSEIWKTYLLPEGYGDGPESSNEPIYALRLEKNNILYSIIFYNKEKTTDQQDLILSTFKFLPGENQETSEEEIFCDEPRPEVCTMECISPPPYICGSNGKFYCNKCAACADWKVDWYIIQSEPCGI